MQRVLSIAIPISLLATNVQHSSQQAESSKHTQSIDQGKQKTAEMSTTEIPISLKKSVEGTKVEYVNLGKSGLRVSVPILGAMSFGQADWASWVIDEEKVFSYLNPLIF